MKYSPPTVIARDPKRGYVLLTGLGVFGLGTMWIAEARRHRDYPGYADAPTQDSTGGFGADKIVPGDLAVNDA